MDQGTEPVKVHAFEGVGRETHHTLLFFALLVMRARSYRYAENSVSFFSVVAHLLHSEISRAAGFPALLQQQHGVLVPMEQASAGRHGERGPPEGSICCATASDCECLRFTARSRVPRAQPLRA